MCVCACVRVNVQLMGFTCPGKGGTGEMSDWFYPVHTLSPGHWTPSPGFSMCTPSLYPVSPAVSQAGGSGLRGSAPRQGFHLPRGSRGDTDAETRTEHALTAASPVRMMLGMLLWLG